MRRCRLGGALRKHQTHRRREEDGGALGIGFDNEFFNVPKVLFSHFQKYKIARFEETKFVFGEIHGEIHTRILPIA